ncbi:MAG: DUF2207 domain-containing protein [Lachnospiraceae bacterium]|nr:DUF2207 domain-containing protein [Lachnospiraceae bacterium]
MDNSKKISLIICLVMIGMFLFPTFMAYLVSEDVSLNPNDYARITDVDYQAVVIDESGSEGSVYITERLTFDVHAASKNNTFWELWRDLPEDYIDGVKVDYEVLSVKQILPNGREIVYEESPVLYWEDEDYVSSRLGPEKWYHSKGPYDENDRRYECVFFYIDDVYREEMVFEIEYVMHNAALRYNDCSDLYLALYSGNTVKYLESFEAEILFPLKDMPKKGNYDVYTYGTNANEFHVTESDIINPGFYTFRIDLNENQLKFRPYNEYIEFDLVSYGKDKHIFTEYAPSNMYSSDNVLDEIYEEQQAYADAPGEYTLKKLVVFALLIGGAIFIIYYALSTPKRLRNKFAFYEPEMQIDYYREIPSNLDPSFATSLVFCKDKKPADDSGVYSAVLLSLARKDYIELRDWGTDEVQIIIKYIPPSMQQTPPPIPQQSVYGQMPTYTPMADISNEPIPMDMDSTADTNDSTTNDYEPLTLSEEYYFNLLVRHATGNVIMMNILQQRVSSDYINTERFVRNMESSTVTIGINENYLQKANYTEPKQQLLDIAKILQWMGWIFVILVNLISYQTRMDLAYGSYFIFGAAALFGAYHLKKQAPKYVLLTQFGENEYAKWRGLYNFLNSDTLMNERTYIELPLWERYLVYATAFGISEKVISAINLRCPDVAQSRVLSNRYYRSGRFHHHSRSFRSAVHSGSHGSFGGGGGFGYGGGGRGGGGGGGGH